MTARPGRGTARLGRVGVAALAVLAVVASACSSPSQSVAILQAKHGVVTEVTCLTSRHCLALGSTVKGSEDRAYELVSNDAGASWQIARHSPPVGTPLGLSCWDSQHCMVVSQSAGAVTSDGGDHWTQLPSPPVTPSSGGALDCPGPDMCLVVGASRTGGGHLFLNSAVGVTTSDGATWSVNPVTAAPVTPAGVSCLNETDCFLVGSTANPDGQGAVWQSTDGGTTWNVATAPSVTALRAITCMPGSSFCIAVATGSQMSVTTDGGNTWTTASVPLPGALAQLTQAACSDTSDCIVTTLTQLVARSDDGGSSYSQATMPAGLESQSAYCTPSGTCLIGGAWLGRLVEAGMVARSTNYGRTWTGVWMSD